MKPKQTTSEPRNFYVWHFKKQTYLAVPAPSDGWHIIRDDGENYGAWLTVDNFRRLQKAGDPNGELGLPGVVAYPVVRVFEKMSRAKEGQP